MKKFLSKPKLLWYSFLISAAFLGLCSKSSPLYPMNDWVDVQCFLTLGKGILNGLAPYVDLYEQKGPLLYMLYALVSLISGQGYLGQFLLEVITYGLFLYFSGKIAGLFLGESRLVYLIIPILAGIVATSIAFCHGGSVEQMCLFIFAYGLYSFMRAFRQERCLTPREAITNGILAGVLFWIKYTMVGFYVGLVLFVLVWYLVWVRKPMELLKTAGGFLAGFGIVTGVVLVFCLATGCLGKMYECYFYNNLFLYPEESELTFSEKAIGQFNLAMEYDLVFFYMLTIGNAFLLICAKERPRDVLCFLFGLIGLCVFTYMGMGYKYYSLTLGAFAVFGLIAVARLLQKIPRTELPQSIQASRAISGVIIAGIAAISLQASYQNSGNTYLMDYDREDLPQYRFTQQINQVEDATLLNFGFLDGGFYHTADVLPTCPFFCTFNVEAPGMWQTQYDYIEQGAVDFVITRRYELSQYNCDGSKYILIDTAEMVFEEYPYTYYLYALKENTK